MGILNEEYNVVENNIENIVMLHPKLEKEIEEFLNRKDVYSSSNSSATYNNYKSDLNWIARHFFGLDSYNKLTLKHFESTNAKGIIDLFIDAYKSKIIATSSLNRKMSPLKGLIEHLVNNYGLEFEIIKLKTELKPFPKDSETIEVLSNEDSDRCIEEFKYVSNGIEMHLLGKLAIDTGLRLNELLTLEWRQFSKEDDKVVIKSVGSIKGKGNKDWMKAISNELYNELTILKKNGSNKLFSISNATASRYMKATLTKLGLTDKKYSFHSLRKNAVTNAYISSNNDIMVAKKFANHSNVSTTQGYVATRDIEVMGRYSNKSANKDLYKEVTHEDLVNAISKLDEATLIHLNRLLANNVESGKINSMDV